MKLEIAAASSTTLALSVLTGRKLLSLTLSRGLDQALYAGTDE